MRAGILTILGCTVLSGLLSSKVKAESVAEKMRSIIIPSLEMTEVPLTDALAFIQTRSIELDRREQKGVNIILNADGAPIQNSVSLNLRNVTLGRTLWFVAQITGLEVKLDQHAVMLVPAKAGNAARKSVPRPDPVVATKLNTIIIPSVEFTDTPFDDALQFLREFSTQLDTKEPDPMRRGVNIVKIPPRTASEPNTITLRLNKVPLSEALRYTCALAMYDVRIEKGAVIVSPQVPKTKPSPTEPAPFSQ